MNVRYRVMETTSSQSAVGPISDDGPKSCDCVTPVLPKQLTRSFGTAPFALNI